MATERAVEYALKGGGGATHDTSGPRLEILPEAHRAHRVTTSVAVLSVFGQRDQAARIHEKLAAQVGENSHNPPVVGVGLDKPEFAKNVLNMLLDCAFRDKKFLGDSVVGATFGHKGEDLPLAGGERREPFVASPAREKLVHNFGIEHGPARGDVTHRRDEVGDVGNAVLEQVTDACRPGFEQLGAIALLDVLRKHQHAEVEYTPAGLDGRLETLVAVVGWHPDVHYGDVWAVPFDSADQARAVAGLGDDIQASVGEEPRQ